MRLTKEEFCTAVDKYENMTKECDRICQALDIVEWKIDDWLNSYFDLLYDMCDYAPNCDITDLEYYCCELDFGKNWKPGMITIDGEDIPCRNSEELWELVNRE